MKRPYWSVEQKCKNRNGEIQSDSHSDCNMSAQLNYLRRCFDLVFPERDDHRIVRELNRDELVSHFHPKIENDIVSLLPFREPLVRSLVHEAKFHQNERAYELLGEVLSLYLKDQNAKIVIPIPLSDKRLKERGCNQVEEVLKRALRQVPHMQMRTDLLKRTKNTKPQTSLSRQDRLQNVAGAFTIRPGLGQEHIILIDDVSTTGATLRSAASVLESASITLLSLAR